jgi:hypothetical protein
LTCASCAAEKKKPKRRKRQPAQTTTDNNNVSYVDESGIPVSNEIINKSFNRSYIPQPFSRNSSVIGTSFNESTILDKVIEKMSKLNATTNQSMNNTVLNQSTTAPTPAPPRPARTIAAQSTIAPASPSVAPQSLNFDLSSPVRQVGLTPQSLVASSLAMNPVQQQYILASQNAAKISQEAIAKIFKGIPDLEQSEIQRAAQLVKIHNFTDVNKGENLSGQSKIFKSYFAKKYRGDMYIEDADKVGWQYYKLSS